MGETITVCESICRDFSWIWFADPKVLQAGLTLLAASLASWTALHIAKHIYRAQKDIDRRLEAARDARQIYLEVHTVFFELDRYVYRMGRPTDSIATGTMVHIELERLAFDIQTRADFALSRLGIVASTEVLDAGKLVHENFLRFSIGLQAHSRLFEGATKPEAEIVLRHLRSQYFVDWRRDFSGLVNAMRRDFADGEVDLSPRKDLFFAQDTAEG